MDLYARVNILGGRAVRLPRGNVREAIALDVDPVARARNWVAQGADHLHIVDLDAAAHGDYRNRELIDRIIAGVAAQVQVAGGIRSHVEAARLLDQGAWRIVMGTAAIEDQNMVWEICRDYPGRIAVAIDVRPDDEVATRGWTRNSGRYLEEVLIEMSSAGVAAFLIAEAGRDALVEPPNWRMLSDALAVVDEPVIAAGGVRNLEDLRRLVRMEAAGRQLAGVVVGREVTDGRFTIEEAKQVLAGGGPRRAPGNISQLRVVLRVPDFPRSVAFYEGVLGFKRVKQWDDGNGLGILLSASDGGLVELLGPPPGASNHGSSPTGVELVLYVNDVDGWHDHVVGAAVPVAKPPVDHPWGERSFEIEDPDGTTLRFIGLV
jgi:phosphoribosylformimino-5-aminoimidazole carboxamide ribotide isomerase